jgi:hypothetical protein
VSVLIVNTELGLRRRADPTLDEHGTEVGGGYGPEQGPRPGLTREIGTNGAWVLSVDDQLWPIRAGDIITEPSAHREFLVTTASFMKHDIETSINYCRVEARERVTGGTEPGGPEFTGRP